MNRRLEVEKAAFTLVDAYLDAGEAEQPIRSIAPFVESLAKALALPRVDAPPPTDNGDQPLKPTRILAEVMERVMARPPAEPALPKPATDEAPPKPWSDTDTQQDEGDAP